MNRPATLVLARGSIAWTASEEVASADHGDGFDPERARNGTGLQGMADRLDAIGGMLEVRSVPGHGSTVGERVPVG